jgi:hypothetical protein
VEDWEVEENTNIHVVEETKESYLWSSEYAEAYVNVLDDTTQHFVTSCHGKYIDFFNIFWY